MRVSRYLAAAAIAGGALLQASQTGWAQGYPNQTINYVVASSAGSSPDIIGRIIADGLSKAMGQPVVVDDRAGAGGTVAAAIVKDARPDGYTILQVNVNHTAGKSIYPGRKYELLKDFIPVSRTASSFYVFVVNSTVPVKTFDELITYVKAHPGEVNYASAGTGAATFMVTELLKSAAGLDMVHIPYDGGGPATASIVAGETQFYGSPYATAKEFIANGKLRALAVSSAERISYLPDVPSASESVPGFEFTAWYGLMLPAGTPQDIVDALYNGVQKALADPDVQKRLGDQGYVPIKDTQADFGKFLEADIARMAKLVKDNNLAQ